MGDLKFQKNEKDCIHPTIWLWRLTLPPGKTPLHWLDEGKPLQFLGMYEIWENFVKNWYFINNYLIKIWI